MRTAYKRNNYLWRCQKLILSLFLTEILNPALMVILFPLFFVFFLSGFSFTDTDNSQDSRGREGTIFYYTLPLRPAHQHSDIDLQLCMQDDYHIFLIAPLDFTRLLLDEIYHLYRVGGVQLLSPP